MQTTFENKTRNSIVESEFKRKPAGPINTFILFVECIAVE